MLNTFVIWFMFSSSSSFHISIGIPSGPGDFLFLATEIIITYYHIITSSLRKSDPFNFLIHLKRLVRIFMFLYFSASIALPVFLSSFFCFELFVYSYICYFSVSTSSLTCCFFFEFLHLFLDYLLVSNFFF